ncbi:MAG: hypothetical protein HOH33_14790 [Verrucomicrobia bacterium]|jgi:hypothetical protein|nr:hypothetical protein [Verrucomicrobiota bacterium]
MHDPFSKALTLASLIGIIFVGCSKSSDESTPSESADTSPEPSKVVETSQTDSNVIGAAVDGTDQEPKSLGLTWPDGKRFVYEVKIDQTTTAGESSFAAALNSVAGQKFRYSLTADLDEATGNTLLEMEILSAMVNLEMMGNKLTFDSENPAPEGSIDPMYTMLEGLNVLIGEKLTLTYSSEGEITEVKGLDDMYDKISKALPSQAAPVAQGFIQEDQFKQLASYPFWPEASVKNGESWKQKYIQVFGASGAMEVDNTYTLKGKSVRDSRQVNVLTYDGLVIADAAQNADMMGMEMSMTDGTNSGEIYVDQTSGFIVHASSNQEMTMNMKLPEALAAASPGPLAIKANIVQSTQLIEVTDSE